MGASCCYSRSPTEENIGKKYQPESIPCHYVPDPTKKPTHATKQHPTHVALFDYVARGDDEVTFRTGDAFVVTGKIDDWWEVRCLRTNETGYGPSNYIASINTHRGESWFAGCIGRGESNRTLLGPENQKGAFLVRESQQNKDDFTLCVLDHNTVDGRVVKAYLIRRSSNEGKFYIYEGTEFRTLTDLVKYYSRTHGGLCCQLIKPCVIKSAPSLPSIAKNVFEVSRESITFIEPIGHGSFGEVWRGLWNDTVEVAIKKLTPGKMTPSAFAAEADIMRDMRHRNLVQLQAVVVNSEPLLIVTEYMHLGNLQHYLRKGEGRNSSRSDYYDMAAQVAAGLEYMESINYVHRDVRASNVLVGENNVYKLADFGLARMTDDEVYNAAMDSQYPVKWTAPEGLTHQVFSNKSDVWSFGILLTEIVTKGGVPYPGMTNPEVEPALRSGYRIPQPANCDDEMYQKMRQCWEEDPERRPTFKSLKEFFEDRSAAYVCIHRMAS